MTGFKAGIPVRVFIERDVGRRQTLGKQLDFFLFANPPILKNDTFLQSSLGNLFS